VATDKLSPAEYATLPQGDLRLLGSDVAQELLHSKELARLAYTALDGTPRVLPIMFHWNGREIVLASFAGAAKLPALTKRPEVALTIDTSAHPPHILLVRGSVVMDEVDGVAPEFRAANIRYGGEDFGNRRIAEVDRPGLKMVRLVVEPTWVGVLDFQVRFSGQRSSTDFARRGQVS